MAAPVTLLLARLLQGFSVGGEYGTSATYMSEVTPADQRGFYSGVLYVTLVMGQLLSLGSAAHAPVRSFSATISSKPGAGAFPS